MALVTEDFGLSQTTPTESWEVSGLITYDNVTQQIDRVDWNVNTCPFDLALVFASPSKPTPVTFTLRSGRTGSARNIASGWLMSTTTSTIGRA